MKYWQISHRTHICKKGFFFTDGKPAGELQDRNTALEELKKNGWFYNAFRFVLLIGDSYYDPAAREAVKDFVKSPDEEVLSGKDLESLLISLSNPRIIGPGFKPILPSDSYENGSFIDPSLLSPHISIQFD